MRLFQILIIPALILTGPAAFAVTQPLTQSLTQPRAWDCKISAKVVGWGQHFLYYGRDAWNGDGSLYCESGNTEIYRKVAVSFNSAYAGFGADRNSSVQVLINLSTRMAPADLQIRTLVSDLNNGPRVQWSFSSELNDASVYVNSATPVAALRSLQGGTLFIRSAGE